MKIFIGYDKREAIAYHVCSNSLIRHSTGPLEIVPLALNNLKTFYGEEHKDGSNDFIYSRFLVPYLCGFTGTALFMDGDMVVLDDVSKLFELADPRMAVQVVKHEYKTKAEKKYLGSINEDYPCKNWSSVILWNCNHFANRKLTPDNVAKMSGSELHRFTWIEPDRVNSFFTSNGNLKPILDDELKLIQAEAIDSASEIINLVYDKLFEMDES